MYAYASIFAAFSNWTNTAILSKVLDASPLYILLKHGVGGAQRQDHVL